MKVIIHGATYSTNFGDVLFAYLFFNKLNEIKDVSAEFLEMPKYGIQKFCADSVGYRSNSSFFRQLNADALIMMSGGYFGENVSSFKNSLKRYLQYVLPARLFQIFRKPVYIIGVGGGPLISSFLRKSCVRMLNRSKYISVRDEETKNYFVEYGVTKPIIVTTDTAQVINSDLLRHFPDNDNNSLVVEGRKYIFFHVVDKEKVDARISEVIVPAVNEFLANHKDYDIIVGNDEIISAYRIRELETYKKIMEGRKKIVKYENIFMLCKLLDVMDFVITPKLHVGIVSAALGKSVVSFPIHREKTERYYRQIGEAERSIHMQKVTTDIAYNLIERYYDKPIQLNKEIRNLANYNLSVLEDVVTNN